MNNVPAKLGRDRVLGKICMNAKDGVKRVTGVEAAQLQWIWTGQEQNRMRYSIQDSSEICTFDNSNR